MISLSIATHICDALNWIFKIFGKKLVDINKYTDEIRKVKMDYPQISSQCQKEKANGSTFLWSEYDTVGYERYFELDGNTRKFFVNDSNQYLLIKK